MCSLCQAYGFWYQLLREWYYTRTPAGIWCEQVAPPTKDQYLWQRNHGLDGGQGCGWALSRTCWRIALRAVGRPAGGHRGRRASCVGVCWRAGEVLRSVRGSPGHGCNHAVANGVWHCHFHGLHCVASLGRAYLHSFVGQYVTRVGCPSKSRLHRRDDSAAHNMVAY